MLPTDGHQVEGVRPAASIDALVRSGDHKDVVGTMMQLRGQGNWEAAATLLQKAREELAARQATLGDQHIRTQVAKWNLSGILQVHGDLDGAKPLLRETLATMRETLGDQHRDTLSAINNLGRLLHDQQDFEGAAALLREALATRRTTLGKMHPDTLTSMQNLGTVLQDRGDLDGAAPLLREALAVRRVTLGDMHQDTLVSMISLGVLLKEQGDLDGAILLHREALAAQRTSLGNKHPQTLGSIGNLGMLLQQQGETLQALPLLRELQAAVPSAAQEIVSKLEAEAAAFRAGTRVRICGLVSKPELNGRRGRVVGPATAQGRLPVEVGDIEDASPRVLALKLLNLELDANDSSAALF